MNSCTMGIWRLIFPYSFSLDSDVQVMIAIERVTNLTLNT